MNAKIPTVVFVSMLFVLQTWASTAGTPPLQFLGILRLQAAYYPEAAWTREAGEAVGRHFTRLQEQAQSGKVILAGRTDESNERTMGIVIFEAGSLEEAEEFMASDPAVVAGIMTAEVRPYAIAVIRRERREEPDAAEVSDDTQ